MSSAPNLFDPDSTPCVCLLRFTNTCFYIQSLLSMHNMNKAILIFLILHSGLVYGQNKKEQITQLNIYIDSLESVLYDTRLSYNKEVSSLKNSVDTITTDLNNLKVELAKLQSHNHILTEEKERLNIELENMSQRILSFESERITENAQIESYWEYFNLDETPSNFLSALLLLSTSKWMEIDGHYDDHYGARKYSIDDPRYSLIKSFSGEGGSQTTKLFLLFGDKIILFLTSATNCEDYFEGTHTEYDFSEYSVVYFDDQKKSFSYGQRKDDCEKDNPSYPYENRSNLEMEYSEALLMVKDILVVIEQKDGHSDE